MVKKVGVQSPKKPVARSLEDLAISFGIRQRKLRQELVKKARMAGAVEPTAAPATALAVPVPIGTEVDLTVIQDNVAAEVFLNHELLPPQDVYHLDLLEGPNALAWLITPAKAPWRFQVDLTINGAEQTLDNGSGTSVVDPILHQAALLVS